MNPHRRCAWCTRITDKWLIDKDGDVACMNDCEKETPLPTNIEVSTPVIDRPRARRGFACMSKDKQREIASAGGKRCAELGRGYRFDSVSGSIAGRLGGLASRGGRGKLVTQESGT